MSHLVSTHLLATQPEAWQAALQRQHGGSVCTPAAVHICLLGLEGPACLGLCDQVWLSGWSHPAASWSGCQWCDKSHCRIQPCWPAPR